MAQAAYGTRRLTGAEILAKIHSPNAPGPGPAQR